MVSLLFGSLLAKGLGGSGLMSLSQLTSKVTVSTFISGMYQEGCREEEEEGIQRLSQRKLEALGELMYTFVPWLPKF